MGPMIVDVGSVVQSFIYRVEQASVIAGLSVCSVYTVKRVLGGAISVVAGYTSRADFLNGWCYTYLVENNIVSDPAREMLLDLVNELDEFIFNALGERAFYNHFFIEMGQANALTRLTIWRLGNGSHQATLADRFVANSS